MREALKQYASLMNDPGFLHFRKELSREVYEALGAGYARNDNEVGLVTKLVEATNGKSFANIRIKSRKIHGSRSYVEFSCRDKIVTKELGDMLVLTLVTNGHERILQKLSIVQNKVLKKATCKIDDEQLFLLKNFPPFSGTKGIFSGMNKVLMFNNSRCLGSYMFFDWPGDASFVTAGNLAQILAGKENFKKDFLALLPPIGQNSVGPATVAPWTAPWFYNSMMVDEFLWILGKKSGWQLALASGIPPFGSYHHFLDIHDFIDAWMTLAVGELTYAFGTIVDSTADMIGRSAIQAAGLSNIVKMEDSDGIDTFFNSEISVLVLHVNLGNW